MSRLPLNRPVTISSRGGGYGPFEALLQQMLFSYSRLLVRLGRILVVAFSLVCRAHIAFAQDVVLDFNIPSQPLPAALERYGDITGRNILYNSDIVTDRRSMPVEGRLSPDAALRKLLQGTKLSAVQVTPTSFTLSNAPAATTALSPSTVTDYYGRIQISLRNALCSIGQARPGNYRIGMRLWIDSDGSVARYERLNSTGTPYVDATVDQALRHLKIGARPPLELAQPVSVVILPQGPGVTMSCARPVADGVRP